ncbi:hypothetical protein RRF57_006056 [Xylaria bambusicola]|uniref:Uncharacterized protein n=1 Tax=Xylaria bambusicola TaxID=326684 RepID=A0AAN7URH2_9PEZI
MSIIDALITATDLCIMPVPCLVSNASGHGSKGRVCKELKYRGVDGEDFHDPIADVNGRDRINAIGLHRLMSLYPTYLSAYKG